MNIKSEQNVIVCINDIFFPLCAVLALSPMLRFSWDILPQTIINSLMLTLFLFTVFQYKCDFINSVNRWLVIFLLFAVLSLPFSSNIDSIRNELFLLADALIIFFLTNFLTPARKKQIILIINLVGLYFTFLMIAHFFLDPADFLIKYRFINELIIRFNVVAGFLVISFPLSFIFWSKNNKTYYLISLLLLIGIILTKSRFAIIVAFLELAIYLWFRFKQYTSTIIKIAIPSTLLLIWGITALKLSLGEAMFVRIQWWKTALKMFLDNPWFGVGLGNFGHRYFNYKFENTMGSMYAHNIFLQIPAEIGIFGALAFIGILVSFFITYKRVSKEPAPFDMLPIYIAVGGFIAVNIVDFSFYLPANMFLFFFCLSLVHNVKYEVRQRSSYIIPAILSVAAITGFLFLFFASVYKQNGIYYLKQKDYYNAEIALVKSIQLDGWAYSPFTVLTEVYISQYGATQDEIWLRKAIGSQNEAIKRFPHAPILWSNISWLFKQIGQNELAASAEKKAKTLESNHHMNVISTNPQSIEHKSSKQ